MIVGSDERRESWLSWRIPPPSSTSPSRRSPSCPRPSLSATSLPAFGRRHKFTLFRLLLYVLNRAVMIDMLSVYKIYKNVFSYANVFRIWQLVSSGKPGVSSCHVTVLSHLRQYFRGILFCTYIIRFFAYVIIFLVLVRNIFRQICKNVVLPTNVVDPSHFGTDPDPLICNSWLTDPETDPAIFVSDLQGGN